MNKSASPSPTFLLDIELDIENGLQEDVQLLSTGPQKRLAKSNYHTPRIWSTSWWKYCLSVNINRSCISRSIFRSLMFLSFFASGLLFALIVFPLIDWPEHDNLDDIFRHFDDVTRISPSLPGYPSEFFKSVQPIPCHSHNDYWRRWPLFSALATGCTSVEADIWLVPGSNDLLVSHRDSELNPERSLSRLYINPLVEILDKINGESKQYRGSTSGVFYQDPSQTLVLLIDFKTANAWDLVVEQLEPLRQRNYLTYWNGVDRVERPITIVASGDAPFDRVIANSTYRDIFYDAPLANLPYKDIDDPIDFLDETNDETKGPQSPYKYNPSNSYYASTSLSRAVGLLSDFALTQPQIELIRDQIEEAKNMGLKPRYWGTPRWPRSLRDEIWGVLVREGVSILNVDDLRAMRKGRWGKWPQGG